MTSQPFLPSAPPSDPNARLDFLLARGQIVSKLAMYARATDRLDVPLLHSLFWPDCEINMGAVKGKGHEALSVKILLVFATQQHPVSNVRIQLDTSGTRCRTEATLTARSLIKGGGSNWSVSGLHGRYLDEWELRKGEWKILRRQLVQDFATMTKIQGEPEFSSKRSTEDPSYAFFGADIDITRAYPKDLRQLEDASEIVDRLYGFSIGRDSEDATLLKRSVWDSKYLPKKVGCQKPSGHCDRVRTTSDPTSLPF